jgi:VIT1/CCC1 family predicted Fe2+/Mn2+ transporter
MKQSKIQKPEVGVQHAQDVATSTATLNKLRAAVLGANDGIVSVFVLNF